MTQYHGQPQGQNLTKETNLLSGIENKVQNKVWTTLVVVLQVAQKLMDRYTVFENPLKKYHILKHNISVRSEDSNETFLVILKHCVSPSTQLLLLDSNSIFQIRDVQLPFRSGV